MAFFKHLLIFASYAFIAAVVAVATPSTFPVIDANLALVIGGLVLVGSMALHEVFARRERDYATAQRFYSLQQAYMQLKEDVGLVRRSSSRIEEALELGPDGKPKNIGPDMDKVVAEVRVLQSLIEQLSTKRATEQKQEEKASSVNGRTRVNGMPLPTRAIGREGPAPILRPLDDDVVLEYVRQGLRGDRIDLYLQPIVSLPQRKVRFFECFSRIRVDDESMMLAEQYISLAEKEGLIAAIDNLLLFRCVQLVRKAQKNNHNVGFFCNISPHTLMDRKFFGEFIDFMADNTGLARNLFFEFSQADLATRWDDIAGDLDRLAGLGFQFSMDRIEDLSLDFGDLARRNIRFVKIEAGTLLARRPDDLEEGAEEEDGEGIVDALKRGLNDNDIDLIVEKLEAEEDLIELLDYDIDFGQGYLFGEPRISREA
ncbi:MAG: EAL domain-containing protein [Proteobacteria bacterium]|nr:EAL domain-containing protein [Pseudomonadota bacterium]